MPTSQRKIEANRRNARKSTGPRSAEGKASSAANSRNHFCNLLPVVPGECDHTYYLIKGEMEQELRPATPLQRFLFDQIVDHQWRIMRINDIERTLLLNEARRMQQETGDPAVPCTVIARLMEKGPRNPVMSLQRYQMQLQSMQLKLIKQFWWQKKHHPTVGYAEAEIHALQAIRHDSEDWQARRRAEQDETDRWLREQEEEQWREQRRRREAEEQRPRFNALPAAVDDAALDDENRANEPTRPMLPEPREAGTHNVYEEAADPHPDRLPEHRDREKNRPLPVEEGADGLMQKERERSHRGGEGATWHELSTCADSADQCERSLKRDTGMRIRR